VIPHPKVGQVLKLVPDGYSGCDCCGYGGCSYVQLWLDDKLIYESDWYENHPDEWNDMYKELRKEIGEIFSELGLDTNLIEDYEDDCIWDWEFEYTFGEGKSL
jgi:hypothetical protein